MEQIKHAEHGEVMVKGTVTGYKKTLGGTQLWVRVKIGGNEIWVREENVQTKR